MGFAIQRACWNASERKPLLSYQNHQNKERSKRSCKSSLLSSLGCDPSKRCLAELHYMFSKSRCVTSKDVGGSHFICCLVNTWPGLLELPEHGNMRPSSGPT